MIVQDFSTPVQNMITTCPCKQWNEFKNKHIQVDNGKQIIVHQAHRRNFHLKYAVYKKYSIQFQREIK